MRKTVSLLATVLIAAIIFVGCGDVSNAVIDVGKSKIYSEADRNEVAAQIKDMFYKNFDRCTLHKITYLGDKRASEKYELDYCRELWEKDYKECMIFSTEFHSPSDYRSNEAWNLDFEYDYTWYFAREDGGNWEYITSGQG